MTVSLPQPYSVTENWTWKDYAPHFEALLETELTAENVDDWISRWSAAYATISEAQTRKRIAHNQDTTDEAVRQALEAAIEDIAPNLEKAQFELNTKLLESGLVPDGMAIIVAQMAADNSIYNPANVPLQIKTGELSRDYQRIVGGQAVDWHGEEKTVYAMKLLNTDPDRSVREAAWRAIADRQAQDREAINAIWTQLMDLRKQIYQNAGLNDYREYAWKNRHRLDYTPEDALQFCESVAEVVVPQIVQYREAHRQRLGLEKLRPWDAVLEVHDLAPDPDAPQRDGPLYHGEADLIARSAAVFDQLDPELSRIFQTMREEGWLDLANRKGKRPGAFSSPLPVAKGAFMFGNASGNRPDISMVLHEAGHSFHAFYSADTPLVTGYWGIPFEFAEVASTAMELLAIPYLTADRGGFFTEREHAHYVMRYLEEKLSAWAYMATVVAFQHWVYTHHDAATDPANCDAAWTELWLRYSPGIDYSGLEDWVATGWHRKPHIFGAPFYYIEYGLAQLGAVQIWANALEDQQAALEAYRKGLKMGNTVDLRALFAAVGGKLGFDAATFTEAVKVMEQRRQEAEAAFFTS